jgi:NAD(P)-dependent dehydrogenase (short-subunit alcohol dehydrogenase family)
VRIEKDYVFEGPNGRRTLRDLFDGRRQLLLYHFMFEPEHDEGGLPSEVVADFLKDARGLMPLGRFGTADEAANVALFLASEESSFITGSEIAVDGGFAQV